MDIAGHYTQGFELLFVLVQTQLLALLDGSGDIVPSLVFEGLPYRHDLLLIPWDLGNVDN